MAQANHFRCTACGKCCFGTLPLTLSDALENAIRFPLALLWIPVAQGAAAFRLGSQLGTAIQVGKRRRLALVITPVAYLPPAFPCPELGADNLCGIHANKPSRCRTMPFYPFRQEQDQADLLLPRPGWACDTSPSAPVVYRNQAIVERSDFDLERRELLNQAPTMRAYADYMLKYTPGIAQRLDAASMEPEGKLITSLSSFLTAIKSIDATGVARQQLPIFEKYAASTATTAELLDYHRNYAAWAREMEFLAR